MTEYTYLPPDEEARLLDAGYFTVTASFFVSPEMIHDTAPDVLIRMFGQLVYDKAKRQASMRQEPTA